MIELDQKLARLPMLIAEATRLRDQCNVDGDHIMAAHHAENLIRMDNALSQLREQQALLRDAERYRKLRAMHWSRSKLVVTDAASMRVGAQCYSGETLDEVIDQLPAEREKARIDDAQ